MSKNVLERRVRNIWIGDSHLMGHHFVPKYYHAELQTKESLVRHKGLILGKTESGLRMDTDFKKTVYDFSKTYHGEASVFVIQIGSNNMRCQGDPAQIVDGLLTEFQELKDHFLKEKSQALVITSVIPDDREPLEIHYLRLNTSLKEMFNHSSEDKDRRLHYVDFFGKHQVTKDETTKEESFKFAGWCYKDDGMHLNKKGAAIFAKEIVAKFPSISNKAYGRKPLSNKQKKKKVEMLERLRDKRQANSSSSRSSRTSGRSSGASPGSSRSSHRSAPRSSGRVDTVARQVSNWTEEEKKQLAIKLRLRGPSKPEGIKARLHGPLQLTSLSKRLEQARIRDLERNPERVDAARNLNSRNQGAERDREDLRQTSEQHYQYVRSIDPHPVLQPRIVPIPMQQIPTGMYYYQDPREGYFTSTYSRDLEGQPEPVRGRDRSRDANYNRADSRDRKDPRDGHDQGREQGHKDRRDDGRARADSRDRQDPRDGRDRDRGRQRDRRSRSTSNLIKF